MAYFARRSGKVYITFYDTQGQKLVRLSRDEIRHMDGWSDEDIRRWVEQWEEANGRKARRSLHHTLGPTDEITRLFEKWLVQYQNMRAVRDSAVAEREYLWRRFIVPYFVGTHGEQDVRGWTKHVPGFTAHLIEADAVGVGTIKKACQTLRLFGRYLARYNVIGQPWDVEEPVTNAKLATPLLREIAPEEVLAAAETLRTTQPDWALALLLGYFGSLRPEETFALDRGDFLTGDRAMSQSKTYDRFTKYTAELKDGRRTRKVALGSKLSISITKAVPKGTLRELPKTHTSYGVVNIWLVDGARAIAELLRDRPPGPLFTAHRDTLNKRYRKIVRPLVGVNAHDLRRGSALYLGRTVGVEPFLLQDHLRHSSLEMLELYTRRPLTETAAVKDQDFDDVG